MDDSNAEHRRVLDRANASVVAAAPLAAADPNRPIFHLTSQAYWINDPNGPVYHDGEYHVFFQHNPFGNEWDNMCWGHTVSRDLVHWEHLPIALAPNPGSYDQEGIFSGCCVIDNGLPTILYTGVHPECQCIATSNDRLRSWTKHPANPVIAAPPRDGLGGFRDPFCWKQGGEWSMVVGSRLEDAGGCVLLYRSTNLREWTYLGPLYVGDSEMMECPNFFPLGDKWVLCVSPYGQVVYKVGTFSDDRFSPETDWLPMDLGCRQDFYAPNSMVDAEGRRIQWGWVNVGPQDGYWSGVLTLPRLVSLRADGRLGIQPLPELAQLRGRHQGWMNLLLADQVPVRFTDLPCNSMEINAEFELGGAEEVGVTIDWGRRNGKGVTVTYDHRDERLCCADRAGEFRLPPCEDRLQLRVFVDRCVIEVYANGRSVLTTRCGFVEEGDPPRSEGHTVTLFAQGGQARALALDVWEMKSIWAQNDVVIRAPEQGSKALRTS